MRNGLRSDRVWQGGGGVSPCGTKFSLDGWLYQRFGFCSPRAIEAYEAAQRAIVALDPRYIDRLPETVDLEAWSDDPGTPPPLIEAVSRRAVQDCARRAVA